MYWLYKKIPIIFFIFLNSFLLYSQDFLMEISPNPVGRGDRFKIDFFIDYDDMTAINIEQPMLPEGVKLYRGPYKRPYWLKQPDGSSKKKTLVTFTYTAGQPGRYEIGSFTCIIGENTYLTEPKLLRIGLYKRRELYMPYNVVWSFGSETFYEGQAIPLILFVKDLEEVMIFDKVTISQSEKGFLEEADDLGHVLESKMGQVSVFSVPVRSFVFTPSSHGKLKIPGASVSARGINSSTNLTYIIVNKIPVEIKNTGAIGKFTITALADKKEFSSNENVTLHVKVEGVGNLNYFQLQKPFSDSLTLIKTVEVSNYIPTEKGFEGSRETIYTFIPNDSGIKKIIIPAFPFLDPETNKVSIGSSSNVSVKILDNIIADSSSVENFPFLPKMSDSGRFVSNRRYRNPSSYLWLLPGPLIFLIFLLTGNKKIIIGASIVFIAASGPLVSKSDINNAVNLYEKGKYEAAIDVFEQIRGTSHDNSYLSYDLALSYYKLHDYGHAIYEARNAFYHDPLNSDYRNLVGYLEHSAGIEYPINLSFNLYPDAFLFLLMILINLTAFTGVIYLVKKKNIYFILSVLLLSLSILSASGLIFSIIKKGQMVGVAIQKQLQVKKIPLKDAETVLEMNPGESVLVKGQSSNFLFVSTGTGLKGWVDKSNLLILEE